jgi:holo-[acyl-carrier protein] synthase
LQYLAGRFAAKEAIAKALGTGFNGEVAPQEIEIRSRSSGAPKIILSGEASQTAVNLGITDWKLSISHTDSAVIASAIALEARYSGGSRTPCAT